MRAGHLLAAGAAVLATVAGIAPAATAEPKSVAVSSLAIGEKPANPEWQSRDLVPTTKNSCATVRANLDSYKGKGATQVECFDIRPGRADRGDVRAAPSCAGLTQDMWWYNRGGACAITHIVGAIVEVNTGRVLGTYTFEVSQELNLQYNRTQYFENVSIWFASSTGVASAIRSVTMTGRCTGTCRTLDGSAWSNLISPGQRVYGQLVFEGAAGAPTYSTTAYTWSKVPPPGVIPAEPLNWGYPGTIRCDNTLNDVAAGCVEPEYIPTFYTSLAEHRGAAVTVAAAQYYLPDGWGRNVPLTRQTNQTLANANRTVACAPFIASSSVPNDSCDEYAFASTHQSARELGLTGASCAEILPWQATNGQWFFSEFKWVGNERCLISHVDNTYNQLAGSHLNSRTYAPERVIENDQFYVVVTN